MPSQKFATKPKKSSCNSSAELTVLIERICALETDLQKIVDIIEEKGLFTSSDFARIIIKKRLVVQKGYCFGSRIESVVVHE